MRTTTPWYQNDFLTSGSVASGSYSSYGWGKYNSLAQKVSYCTILLSKLSHQCKTV